MERSVTTAAGASESFEGGVASRRAPSWSDPVFRRRAVTAAVVLLLAVRNHDRLLNPQFWAEDGAVFFYQAEIAGWSSLPWPWAGYQNVVPRLVASVAHHLPILWAPAIFAWFSLLATGFVAWFLQSSRIRLPGGWAAALAIAVVPHSGEVYLNLANLQWIMAVALFALAAADDARTKAARVGDLAVLLASGLSGPFSVLAAPFFLGRWWRRRSAWSATLAVVASLCAGVQAISLLASGAAVDGRAWALLRYAEIVGRRLVVSLYTGPAPVSAAVCALAAAGVLGGLAVLVWRNRGRLPGAEVLFGGMLVLLVATNAKVRFDLGPFDEAMNADRYFFAQKILLVWLAAAGASVSGWWLRGLLGAGLALPVVLGASRFVYPQAPDRGWAAAAARIERGERVWAPIQPEGFTFYHPGRKARR